VERDPCIGVGDFLGRMKNGGPHQPAGSVDALKAQGLGALHIDRVSARRDLASPVRGVQLGVCGFSIATNAAA
jgi:hypothetical protein